jgi:hypothetical protein
MDRTGGRRHRWRIGLVVALATVGAEALVLRSRGYGMAGDVVVRYRRGHLFTTLRLPGVSFTALRLGWWRLQHCPVGRHGSLVTPTRMADVTPHERATARSVHDLALP